MCLPRLRNSVPNRTFAQPTPILHGELKPIQRLAEPPLLRKYMVGLVALFGSYKDVCMRFTGHIPVPSPSGSLRLCSPAILPLSAEGLPQSPHSQIRHNLPWRTHTVPTRYLKNPYPPKQLLNREPSLLQARDFITQGTGTNTQKFRRLLAAAAGAVEGFHNNLVLPLLKI